MMKKDDPCIECLGALDEFDAFLILAEINLNEILARRDNTACLRSATIIAEVRKELHTRVMPAVAELAAEPANTGQLEQWIAELEQENPVGDFVRTWNNSAAAYLNAARTICRRAERRMITTAAVSAVEVVAQTGTAAQAERCEVLLSWLNRLSDLLFLLAVSVEEQGKIPYGK
jgi:cob(I)alamin adenosyltransferase